MQYYTLCDVEVDFNKKNIHFEQNLVHIERAAKTQVSDWLQKYGNGNAYTLEQVAKEFTSLTLNHLEVVKTDGETAIYRLITFAVTFYLTFKKTQEINYRSVQLHSNGIVSNISKEDSFRYTFQKSFSLLRLHNKYVVEAKVGNRELIMYKGGVLSKKEYQELLASLRK